MKKLLVLSLMAHHLWVADLAQAAPSETPTFEVLEFVVEGNTLLPDELVERTVMPHMGPGRTLADVEAARAALEKAYQDAGHLTVLVSVPNQKVASGEVRLDVQESAIEKMRITGAQYHLPSRVREQVPSLQPGQVPEFSQVQKELAAVQTADLQITPLIAASPSGQGIDVELKVQDTLPLHGSVEVNNNQSYNTREGRVVASATYANLFQRGHSIGLNWQYAPQRPKDGNTLSLIYGLPLGLRDDLLASFTTSDSDTPTAVSGTGPTSTLTKGEFLGIRWSHRLLPGPWPVRHSAYLALDLKHNRDLNAYANGTVTQRPPLRYPLLSGGYNLSWDGEAGASTTLSTTLKGALSAWAARTVDCNGVSLDQFDCKRAGASADFLAWQVGVARVQPLGGGWLFNVNADAQMASAPLPGGEQYSLGGASTVRGYFDFEQTGDEGWFGRMELVTPSWWRAGDWRAHSLAFFDRGFVHYMNPQASQLGRVHLASRGLGIRLSSGQGLQAQLDVAQPLFDTLRVTDNGARQYASGERAGRSVRWTFSLRQSF